MTQNTTHIDTIVRAHGRGELTTDAAAAVLTLHGITPLRVAAAEAEYRGQQGHNITAPPSEIPALYAAMKGIQDLYTGGPPALG